METQVISGAVMFGEVVSKIHRTGCPVDVELALFDAVVKPIEMHVDCLQVILRDCGVRGTVCGAVVSAHRYRGMWVAEFNEGDRHWYCLLFTVEKRANLCF